MTQQLTSDGFESRFRLFINKQFSRRYGARLIRRGAACQEYVKFQTGIEENVFKERDSIVALWEGADDMARTAHLDFTVTGNNTIEIPTEPDSLLMKDLTSCTYRLPISLCVEPRKAILDVAECEIPEWIDACTAAGLMQDQRIILTKAISQPMLVPASCKMVFEGYIEKKEARSESGKLTMHISCITGQI